MPPMAGPNTKTAACAREFTYASSPTFFFDGFTDAVIANTVGIYWLRERETLRVKVRRHLEGTHARGMRVFAGYVCVCVCV